jgi:hypothetical protein
LTFYCYKALKQRQFYSLKILFYVNTMVYHLHDLVAEAVIAESQEKK